MLYVAFAEIEHSGRSPMATNDPFRRNPTGPSVVVDGKTLCHLEHDKSRVSFRLLETAIEQLVEMLRPYQGAALRVWVDSSLRPLLNQVELERFEEAVRQRRISEGPSGIELDPVFLTWAQETNALVISKDRFRPHLQKFRYLEEPGRTFAPAWLPDLNRWMFVERHAPPDRTPRELHEVVGQLAGKRRKTWPGPAMPSTPAVLKVSPTAVEPPPSPAVPPTPRGEATGVPAPKTAEQQSVTSRPTKSNEVVKAEVEKVPTSLHSVSELALEFQCATSAVVDAARQLWPASTWTDESLFDDQRASLLRLIVKRSRPADEKPADFPSPSQASKVPPTVGTPLGELASELGATVGHLAFLAKGLWPNWTWTDKSPLEAWRKAQLTLAFGTGWTPEPPVPEVPRLPNATAAPKLAEPVPAEAKSAEIKTATGASLLHSVNELALELQCATSVVVDAARQLWPASTWTVASTFDTQRSSLLRDFVKRSSRVRENTADSTAPKPAAQVERVIGTSMEELASELGATVEHLTSLAKGLWPNWTWTEKWRLETWRKKQLTLAFEAGSLSVPEVPKSSTPTTGRAAGPDAQKAAEPTKKVGVSRSTPKTTTPTEPQTASELATLLGWPSTRVLAIARYLWPNKLWDSQSKFSADHVVLIRAAGENTSLRIAETPSPGIVAATAKSRASVTAKSASNLPPVPDWVVTLGQLATTEGLDAVALSRVAEKIWPKREWGIGSQLGGREISRLRSHRSMVMYEQMIRATRHSTIGNIANDLNLQLETVLSAAGRLWPMGNWSATSVLPNERVQQLALLLGRGDSTTGSDSLGRAARRLARRSRK